MRNIVKTILITVLFLLPVSVAFTQGTVTGTVVEREAEGIETPLPGANVYWLGTTRGTTTDSSGSFALPMVEGVEQLIVRHAGHAGDTVSIGGQRTVRIVLRAEASEVDEVQIVGERQATVIDYMSPQSTERITTKELAKAACCNLSESFETNPSIDVSFTDAITGTRQIEMLGLSGIYTQATLENLPYIRGLSSNVGLTFIPGPWIEAINVSKGVGSVVNGYESITGQIDVALRKPEDEHQKMLYVNVFGDHDQRFEGNLNFKQQIGKNWSSMTLLHGSSQQYRTDENGDRFLDSPLLRTFNGIQRWHYADENGWEGQFGIQYVGTSKEGGTHGLMPPVDLSKTYQYGTNLQMVRLHGKTGHVFEGKPYSSVGLQWSLARYRTASQYGSRSYEGTERTGYLNLIYQSIIESTIHQFRTGLSFLFDAIDERFAGNPYVRTERVPGVFFEYTYSPAEVLSVVAGVRADYHNAYGSMITPRLHVRYAPHEDWIFRAVAGRGYRSANIFTENGPVFASGRSVTIEPAGTFGYGLKQEIAWNMGVNLTHYFLVNYREATVRLDLYRTMFEQQVAMDLDTHPGEVRFRSLSGSSYANSAQVELNLQPVDHLATRLAYRFLDVRQRLEGIWYQRALSAQHRALLNLAYNTADEDAEEPETGTIIDLTVQWFGPKRLPGTSMNPEGLRARQKSPSFALLNAQVTRPLISGLELYVGGENLLGFRQDDPILDAGNPSGPFFDASLVWGPITGRILYAGLRYSL